MDKASLLVVLALMVSWNRAENKNKACTKDKQILNRQKRCRKQDKPGI
jgi:hypothetical protein